MFRSDVRLHTEAGVWPRTLHVRGRHDQSRPRHLRHLRHFQRRVLLRVLLPDQRLQQRPGQHLGALFNRHVGRRIGSPRFVIVGLGELQSGVGLRMRYLTFKDVYIGNRMKKMKNRDK